MDRMKWRRDFSSLFSPLSYYTAGCWLGDMGINFPLSRLHGIIISRTYDSEALRLDDSDQKTRVNIYVIRVENLVTNDKRSISKIDTDISIHFSVCHSSPFSTFLPRLRRLGFLVSYSYGGSPGPLSGWLACLPIYLSVSQYLKSGYLDQMNG